MPNWCYTDYRFYADTEVGKQQLKSFYDELEKSLKPGKRFIVTDFEDTWLGNVLLHFVPQLLKLSQEDVYCEYENERIRFRGSVIYLAYDEDCHVISVQTETAWEPMEAMWAMILAECKYSDIKFVYLAEEPSMGVYINTDSEGNFFADKYRTEVKVSDDFYDYDIQYFETEQEVLAYLNEVICNLRTEYKINPNKYLLPKDFTPARIRKQRTVAGALHLIQNNLFDDGFVCIDEFTSG